MAQLNEDRLFEGLKERLLDLPKEEGNILTLMEEAIDGWSPEQEEVGQGRLISMGDGIARVSGLEGVKYGEVVIFHSGVRGMVQELAESEAGCILFGESDQLLAGSPVRRTGKVAGIPVGEGFIGRIVDAFGAPIDGLGQIHAEAYYPMEAAAPGILDRQSVNRPMETGLLAIDSMFPIGRGQRELIIGDRQTGKTSIAVDAILNQKGKDIVCIYVAIGQKASSVAQIAESLRQAGAMDYTIIVNATAADPSSLQFLAPYAGTAIGEYFMHKGRDVLIVYDDLSKHAVAYRTLSLLLERSPGREAYPGDVFYLHSRLLERSAKLADELGGGSMTALPIVETQMGDVSAYIPTNIISITDGQIFLESDLFFAGQRPAVNVGLSVSRVGGAAQTKAMKQAVGTLRLDLAQYREMEVFTQFSSDLDEITAGTLRYGQSLMQLLKQEVHRPYRQHEQVILLLAALNHIFRDLEPGQIYRLRDDLLRQAEERLPEVCRSIDKTGRLNDSDRERILQLGEERAALMKSDRES